MKVCYTLFCVAITLISINLYADNTDNSALVFTAPPRETQQKGIETYKPIADFLAKKLKQKVVYEQPISWLHYKRDIINNNIDIAFDGPHFVSWRINNYSHVAVAKLPQPHVWIIIKSKANSKINSLKDVEGKKFCGQQPPNFGTLTALTHFGVTRVPLLIPLKGWKNIYKGVVAGKCVAGILPKTNLKKFDPENKYVEVLHTHPAFPNQAITVNSNIKSSLIKKIQKALLSEEGQKALYKLRQRYSKGRKLIKPIPGEYKNVSDVLSNTYGFGYTFKTTKGK